LFNNMYKSLDNYDIALHMLIKMKQEKKIKEIKV